MKEYALFLNWCFVHHSISSVSLGYLFVNDDGLDFTCNEQEKKTPYLTLDHLCYHTYQSKIRCRIQPQLHTGCVWVGRREEGWGGWEYNMVWQYKIVLYFTNVHNILCCGNVTNFYPTRWFHNLCSRYENFILVIWRSSYSTS